MWLTRVKGTLIDTVQCNYSLIMQHSMLGQLWNSNTAVVVLGGTVSLKLTDSEMIYYQIHCGCRIWAKKIEHCWPEAHYYCESVLHPSWIITMSGWLTHCHVLIMKACASRSCSTAVAPFMTGRHCGAIVIWNILYRSCGGDARLLMAQTPSFSCLSALPAQRKGLQWWEELFT